MKPSLLTKLSKLIEGNPAYIVEGKLNKNLLAADARKYDSNLLNTLQKDKEIKEHFFTETDGGLVFKKDVFLQFISNKQFLPDSFTKYKIKIGLGNDDGSLLAENGDVVLNWPYKDAILEGGQDKEDQKRSEVFFNEVLAPDQITRLLDDKVFTNWKRFDKGGEHELDELKDNDNLIIKGNNLVVLHSLKKRFTGKVKLIYIDPPYNTGSDSFGYNDKFNHSTWLTFMKNRLDVAKKLLRKDGLIFVQCDDNELSHLGVLLSEVFGRENFINLVTIKTKIGGVSGSSEGKSLRDATEFIFVYANNKEMVSVNPVLKKTPLGEYIQNYKDTGKSWKYTSIITKLDGKRKIKQIGDASLYSYESFESVSIAAFAKQNDLTEDEVYEKYPSKIFRTTNAQSSVRATVMEHSSDVDNTIVGLEYAPIKGKNKGSVIEILYKDASRNMLMFLSDVTETDAEGSYYLERVNTLWDDVQYNNLAKEGDIDLPNGKKPEMLISRIIDIATSKGDIVLDYHVGSGTTAAVAHKMGRQYIGIEQLYYGDNDPMVRLQNVINGDQSGISKSVDWQGGGSFVYANIMNNANMFRERVEKAKSDSDYITLVNEASSSSFLSYRVDPSKLNED
jgi:adenine-specific DNA-methyltransferase